MTTPAIPYSFAAGQVAASAQVNANFAYLLSLIGGGQPLFQANTTEDVLAGALINIYDNAGSVAVRNANASTPGLIAHGYVLATALSGTAASVYVSGLVTGLISLTPGPLYLAPSPGLVTSTAPTTPGQFSQLVGFCADSTGQSFVFQPQQAFNL